MTTRQHHRLEPITLEDVYLGEFEIRLDVFRLSELSSRIPYTVIALHPHPASSSDDVTHPHVSGRHLCEGDGSAAIRAALSHGRLFDFFSMVLGVLRTYNSDSPYVRLEDWNGVSCYDCGREMNREVPTRRQSDPCSPSLDPQTWQGREASLRDPCHGRPCAPGIGQNGFGTRVGGPI